MGFFKSSKDVGVHDSSLNDIHGNKNVNQTIHNDNRKDCDNTTIHNVGGNYTDNSVSNNSSGHITNINRGSGAFFAGPQRGYYHGVNPGNQEYDDYDEYEDEDVDVDVEDLGYEPPNYHPRTHPANYGQGYFGDHSPSNQRQQLEDVNAPSGPLTRYRPNNPFVALLYATRSPSNPFPTQGMAGGSAGWPQHPHYASAPASGYHTDGYYVPQSDHAFGLAGLPQGRAILAGPSVSHGCGDSDQRPID